MLLLMIVIFITLFGVMLVSIGFAARFTEAQRRKKVSAVLDTVQQGSGLPQSKVLVETVRDDQPSLSRWIANLSLSRSMERQFQQAGLDWTVNGFLVRTAVAALAGALIGWKVRVLLLPGLSILALAVFLGVMPFVVVRRKRTLRLRAFEQQFPEALDFLARAMRAGHAFPVSMEMLSVESPEPLQSEFRKLFNEHNLGAQLSQALEHLAERVPLLDVRFFVSAVLMQRETGGNLGEILTKLSSVIRDRFRLKGQVRAASAHGRITAAVLTIMPIAVSCLLMAIYPEHLLGMARQVAGKYMIIGAICLQVIGYFIMRKIVNIKV